MKELKVYRIKKEKKYNHKDPITSYYHCYHLEKRNRIEIVLTNIYNRIINITTGNPTLFT